MQKLDVHTDIASHVRVVAEIVGQRGELVDLHVVRQRWLLQVVFVFDLEQDYARLARRLAGNLVPGDDRTDGVIPMLAPRQVDRVVGAQPMDR